MMIDDPIIQDPSHEPQGPPSPRLMTGILDILLRPARNCKFILQAVCHILSLKNTPVRKLSDCLDIFNIKLIETVFYILYFIYDTRYDI